MKSPSWSMMSEEQVLARCKAAGFTVEHYEVGAMRDIFRPEFEATGESQVYADKVTKWYRAFSEMLIGSPIAAERRNAALEAVYATFREIVAAECKERVNYVANSMHVVALSKPQ